MLEKLTVGTIGVSEVSERMCLGNLLGAVEILDSALASLLLQQQFQFHFKMSFCGPDHFPKSCLGWEG